MNQTRFVVNSCSVEDYIESFNNKNFKAKTTRDFLNEFLRQENEERELHNIPAEELHFGGHIHRNFLCNFQYQDICVLCLPNHQKKIMEYFFFRILVYVVMLKTRFIHFGSKNA